MQQGLSRLELPVCQNQGGCHGHWTLVLFSKMT